MNTYTAFADNYDKEQAWNNLIRFTQYKYSHVRMGAVSTLVSTFPHVPDREKACKDLIRLAQVSEYSDVRGSAASALGSVFTNIPDASKTKVWQVLYQLSKERENSFVQKEAVSALIFAFPHVLDKEQAWDDLILLTKSESVFVRNMATSTLISAFPHIPDKWKTWEDLHRLTNDNTYDVRASSADTLGYLFTHLPDKEKAWDDLIRLLQDKNSFVCNRAALALVSAFPHVPDKGKARNEMIQVTKEGAINARVSVNHSMGKISIYRATVVESEEDFKKELENALEFFKKSSDEAIYYDPSSFCLPFYSLFYAITLEKPADEAKIQKYLGEAKEAAKNSKVGGMLVSTLGILTRALRGVRNFNAMKFDLDEYRQYCEGAASLLETTEKDAPWATKIIRIRGLPIIKGRIEGMVSEIQEKAKDICEWIRAARTPFEPLCDEVDRCAEKLSLDDDQKFEEAISEFISTLEGLCEVLPEDKIGYVRVVLEKTIKNVDIADKLNIIKLVLKYVQTIIATMGPTEEESPKEDGEYNVPYDAYLIVVLYDVFKTVYQKPHIPGVSEVNSKTLEALRWCLTRLIASNREVIKWLDVGCGNGRCLDALDDIDIENRKRIRYHCIDVSREYYEDARKNASGRGLGETKFTEGDAPTMNCGRKYDLVSAVLVLHEIDPLGLPCVLWNMLQALDKKGTLMITDFQGPYELEKGVVAWNADDIKDLLREIGDVGNGRGFKLAEDYPYEFGFYSYYIANPQFDREKFEGFMRTYDKFLERKRSDSIKERENLRKEIKKRAEDILNTTHGISDEQVKRVMSKIEDNYKMKAYKIMLLTNQIEFLEGKILEFSSEDAKGKCKPADGTAEGVPSK